MRKKKSTCQGSEDLTIRKEACSRGSERAARRKTIGRATCSFRASAGQIDVRHYEFTSLEDGRAIVFSDDSGAAVVSEVNHDRTLLATCVLPGYVVSSVQDTGIIVTDVMGAQAVMDLVEQSILTRPITVTFVKPLVPMPMCGFARKRFCKPTHVKRTATQESLLNLYCHNCEQDHSQPRSKDVYEAMRQKFGELTLDPDTQRPILVSETVIFNWLKARYTARKAAPVEVAVAAGIAAADRAQGPAEGSDGDESDEGQ